MLIVLSPVVELQRMDCRDASRVLQDQPQSPLETAVFWTEYVVRHKGAEHRRSSGRHLNWIEYYGFDLVLFVVLLIVVLCKLMKISWNGYVRVTKHSRDSTVTIPEKTKNN